MPFLAAARRGLASPDARRAVSSLLFLFAVAAASDRFGQPAALHWTIFAAGAVWCLGLRSSAGKAASGRAGSGGLRFPRWAALALPLAALAALACRLPLERAPAAGPGAAERAAERAALWLSEKTREIGDAAYLLARAPRLAAAVEGSDLPDLDGAAWRALSAWPLPRGAAGPAEAALYDRRLRPVVWSGGGPDLDPLLERLFPGGVAEGDCPDPAFPLFTTYEQGATRWLLAVECLRNRLGLVTVEFPIAATPAPASGSRPVSAVEAAAGRSMEIQLLRAGEAPDALTRLFERRGEAFLDGPAGAERYFFALRAYDGQLLGAANTAVAPVAAKLRERRAEAAFFASVALLAGAILAGAARLAPAGHRASRAGTPSGPGAAGHPEPRPAASRGPGASLAGIWSLRLSLGVLLDTGAARFGAVPGASGLLSPGAGALPLPGLAATPLDALLTAAALFLSARVAVTWIPAPRPRSGSRGAPRLVGRGAAAGALCLLAAVPGVSAGRGGGLPLAPVWELETGLVEITAWTALLLIASACTLLAAHLLRRDPLALAAALAVLAPYALLVSPDPAAAALLPLLGAALAVSTSRGRLTLRVLRRPLLARQPGYAFALAFLLFAFPPLLLYPALHLAEEGARRRYAEETVPRLAARHALSVCYAASEAARQLDEELPQLDSLEPDTAYRLWLATGLARSPAASALEVRGPDGVVSRFRVGFDRRPAPPDSSPAPGEWSGLDGCAPRPDGAAGASRPAAGAGAAPVRARRRYPSGYSLTLTAAVRPEEMAFLPRPAGTSAHFHLAGGAAPGVFSGGSAPRGLRLHAAGAEIPPGRNSVAVESPSGPRRVSWPGIGAAGHAARVAGWLLLAALLALLTALAARLRLLVPGAADRPRRRSLRMQLTEAVAGAVLIAILGLAVFVERRLSSFLDAARAEEALALADTAARIASELGALDLEAGAEELSSRLAHAADQVAADAALYADGRLVAASRPELVPGGLLPSRPPPETAFSRPAPLLRLREAGAFRYRIAWMPVPAAPDRAPAYLAVPLPADEESRTAGVRAMQRALLFGSGSVALVFAVLLPGFVARRIAAPVRRLSHATRQIAEGRTASAEPLQGAVDELRILGASVERLARRVPSVRRRMREEAAADLTRRVAHDIRNALAPIGISADYIRRVLRDPRGRDPARAVDESVDDILGQVGRLRRISSEFSAVGAPLRLETLDLAALVRATARPWERAANPRVVCRAPEPAPVRADPEIVSRLVENLLQNAVEATEDFLGRNPGEETEIVLRVRSDPASDRARLEVEDHGPGVPEEFRERIFDAAFSTRTRGSGLGLANARRFAEAHGGRISAGPRADGRRGLVITVVFPRFRPGEEGDP